MKKTLAFFLALSLVFCNFASADTFYSWRYRTHATDCTALTDGKAHDLCYEADAQTYYTCVPSAGDCSGAEWKLSPNLIIGTSVQAYDADLTTYAGITPAANIQSILSAADYAAIRTLLSIGAIGLLATVDISANTNLTAGRSLTLTNDDVLADAETYTDTKCVWIQDPTASDDLKSIWMNDTANDATITKLKCESDQTVTAMLQVDDGSPADVDSVDLVCISTPDTDTSLDGDVTVAAGESLDLDVASVSGTPTWVSYCFTAAYND